MSDDPQYIDEIAPLTDEQWQRIVTWGRIWYGRKAAQGLESAWEFSSSMRQIQQMAGQPQTDITALASAIGELANMDDEPEQGA